jgi:methylmalonyl-CoA mutase
MTARNQDLAAQLQQHGLAARALLGEGEGVQRLEAAAREREALLDADARALRDTWPQVQQRDQRSAVDETRSSLVHVSLSGTRIPKVALPRFEDHAHRGIDAV